MDEIFALDGAGAISARLKELEWGRMRRPTARTPVPFPLSDENHAEQPAFHDALRLALHHLDVWAIIATGSATNVDHLRHQLRGIDIALLVTTDSTTVTDPAAYPNELRLVPSNRTQATALLFAAVRALDATTPQPEPQAMQPALRPVEEPIVIPYVAETGAAAAKYVLNLTAQLQAEATRLGLKVTRRYPTKLPAEPLIVVGYDAFGKDILDTRTSSAPTIFSDGCDTDAFHDAVHDKLAHEWHDRPFPFGLWQLASPVVDFEDLGKEAFDAITQVGSGLLAWTSDHDVRRQSFVQQIRDVLTAPETFRFEGIENVATPYQVQDLVALQSETTFAPEDDHQSEVRDVRSDSDTDVDDSQTE